MLQKVLEEIGKVVILVPHVGNTGLNSMALAKSVAALTSALRRLQRIEKWANMVIERVNAYAA